MKFRESGMPDEQLWDTFFTPEQILGKLGIKKDIKVLLDVGCGYGTFLIPAAHLVQEKIIGIDIEQEMIRLCVKKVKDQGIKNVHLLQGDIVEERTYIELDKYRGKIDYICLFNILHCEEPFKLLQVCSNILNEKGKIGVIHWKYDKTPRGPSMEIRPTPELITQWAESSGFALETHVDLPPYHYGCVFKKNK